MSAIIYIDSISHMFGTLLGMIGRYNTSLWTGIVQNPPARVSWQSGSENSVGDDTEFSKHCTIEEYGQILIINPVVCLNNEIFKLDGHDPQKKKPSMRLSSNAPHFSTRTRTDIS